MIGIRSCFFQGGVRRDHLARDQILADVEVFKRPLRLCSPQFAAWDIHFTEAVGLLANTHYLHIADCTHHILLCVYPQFPGTVVPELRCGSMALESAIF